MAGGCCCSHDLAGRGGLCPSEFAAREMAALLRCDWLEGKLALPGPCLGTETAFSDLFFVMYVFIFGFLLKEVQSHLVAA